MQSHLGLCSQGMDCFDQVNQRDDPMSLWNNHEPIFQSSERKIFFFFFLFFCGELSLSSHHLDCAFSSRSVGEWAEMALNPRDTSYQCEMQHLLVRLLPECTKNRVISVKNDCGCDAGGVPSSRFQVLPGLDAAVAVDDITGESW